MINTSPNPDIEKNNNASAKLISVSNLNQTRTWDGLYVNYEWMNEVYYIIVCSAARPFLN